jgi:peptidyl-prolyl cis-trans isomerase B (cyclophilin B)
MTLRKLARFATALLALGFAGCQHLQTRTSVTQDPSTTFTMKDIRIVLKTAKGNIDLTLFPAKAPVTVASFLNLAKQGKYDGIIFHRVIANFMIQGGDPTGTGSGDRGYKFEDECVPELKFDKAGVLAMANAGPGTNGSQFFITHVATPWLNGKHTIFGQVTKGQEVVDAIAQGDKITGVEILDSTDDLFKAQAARLAKFNAAMK